MKYVIITAPHAACFSQESKEYRICDRRSYDAAVNLYTELQNMLQGSDIGVVMFPNISILRSICDTNRFAPCPYKSIKEEVADFIYQQGYHKIVMNIDVHSYPRDGEQEKPTDFYVLLLNNSIANQRIHRSMLFTYFQENKSKAC